MSPAVLTGLAASVVAGEQSAPILGLVVVLAPLAALLVPPHDDARPTALAVLVAGVAAGLVVTGSILAASGVGMALGFSRSQVLAGAVVMVSAGMLGRRSAAIPSMAVVLGILALTGLIAGMAMGEGVSPWVAWERLSSQPRLVFSTTTEWVREGRILTKATTLAFSETQGVTSVSGGVVRVTSPGPGGGTVREWRLGAGDFVTVRAGEQLTAPPGSRLRFEAGKSIPGLAESGVSWAAPRASRSALVLAEALGIAVTLGGGAVTLLGGLGGVSRLGAVVAPVLIFAFALGAASWGVYATWLTPDLAIGASPLMAIVAAPFATAAGGGTTELAAVIVLLVASLLLATAASWTGRLDRLAAGWALQHASVRAVPALVALGAAGLATVLAVLEVEAQVVLRFGLGLAASAWAAPHLATWGASNGLNEFPDTRREPGNPGRSAIVPHSEVLGGAGQGTAIGALVGGGVFVALSLARPLGLDEAWLLGSYPALVAAPLAAAVAALARRRGGRAPAAQRTQPSRVGCPEEGTLRQ